VYSLEDVQAVCEKIQPLSYDERKRVKIQDTELIVSAVPSGNSIGSASWKIEINKFVIFYANDLNDKN